MVAPKNSLSGPRGFSLIGVIMGVGIITIVVAGLMDAFRISMLGQKSIEERQILSNHFQSLHDMMAVQEACTANFFNATVEPFPAGGIAGNNATGLIDAGNLVRFPFNSRIDNSGLRLVSFSIIEWLPHDLASVVLDQRYRGKARVQLNYTSDGNKLGPRDMVRYLDLNVELKGANAAVTDALEKVKIKTCTAIYKRESVWTLKDDGDIFYQDGRVAVGTTNPEGQFHVSGSTVLTDLNPVLRLRSQAGPPNLRSFQIQASGSTLLIGSVDDGWNWTNPGGLNTGTVTLDTAGNLAVTGSVRPGNQTTVVACGPTVEGTIRYNTVSKQVEFCNGTAWSTLGGSTCAGSMIDMYRCPNGLSCGGGAWGFYSCLGQVTSLSSCYTVEYPNSCSLPCTYIGKMCLQP